MVGKQILHHSLSPLQGHHSLPTLQLTEKSGAEWLQNLSEISRGSIIGMWQANMASEQIAATDWNWINAW